MTIEEIIEKTKSDLMGIVNNDFQSDKIVILLKSGLEEKIATELLSSYKTAIDAQYAAKNVWTDLGSNFTDEKSTSIAEIQSRETSTRQKFDELVEMCAILIVAKTLEAKEEFDEFFKELDKRGIKEEQIPDFILRTAYCYYKQRLVDLRKITEYAKNTAAQIDGLKNDLSSSKSEVVRLNEKVEELTDENAGLKKENEKLTEENNIKRDQLLKLAITFLKRIGDDEKFFQAVRSQKNIFQKVLQQTRQQISKNRLAQKIIGKLPDMPEESEEIPETLAQEKDVHVKKLVELLGKSTPIITENNQNTINSDDELDLLD